MDYILDYILLVFSFFIALCICHFLTLHIEEMVTKSKNNESNLNKKDIIDDSHNFLEEELEELEEVIEELEEDLDEFSDKEFIGDVFERDDDEEINKLLDELLESDDEKDIKEPEEALHEFNKETEKELGLNKTTLEKLLLLERNQNKIIESLDLLMLELHELKNLNINNKLSTEKTNNKISLKKVN